MTGEIDCFLNHVALYRLAGHLHSHNGLFIAPHTHQGIYLIAGWKVVPIVLYSRAGTERLTHGIHGGKQRVNKCILGITFPADYHRVWQTGRKTAGIFKRKCDGFAVAMRIAADLLEQRLHPGDGPIDGGQQIGYILLFIVTEYVPEHVHCVISPLRHCINEGQFNSWPL